MLYVIQNNHLGALFVVFDFDVLYAKDYKLDIINIEKRSKPRNVWADQKMEGYCKSTLKSNRCW